MNHSAFTITNLATPVQAASLHEALLALQTERGRRGLGGTLERCGLALAAEGEYYELQPNVCEHSPLNGALEGFATALLDRSAALLHNRNGAGTNQGELQLRALDGLSELWPLLTRPSRWSNAARTLLPLVLTAQALNTNLSSELVSATHALLQLRDKQVRPIMTDPEH